MPSPFPGMDPYLEHPEFFPDLHDSLIMYLREALQPCLSDPYYVAINARAWVEYTRRTIEPDVSVTRMDAPSRNFPPSGSPSAVSVLPLVVFVPNDEVREPFLEIYMVRGNRQLVTAIEVLSPSNKTPGDQGQGLYVAKQRELLASKVNLVEIDFLRGGEHTTVVPRDRAVAAAGPFDYHVCVRKMDELQQQFVYAIRLEQRLPIVEVPLLPGDPGVKVDLQAVLDRCYDVAAYQRVNPYRQAPDPPLTSEQSAWAEDLLRGRGLMPPGETNSIQQSP